MIPTPVTDPRQNPLVVDAPSPWERVEAVLSHHYFEPDLQAARALYAAIAAHRLIGQPVWPMLVGPPGSMKTELLNGLQVLDKVNFVDQITAQTFISGHIVEKGDEDEMPSGLLGRIRRQRNHRLPGLQHDHGDAPGGQGEHPG